MQNTGGSGNDYGYDWNANVYYATPKSILDIDYDSFTQRPTSIYLTGSRSLTLQYGGETQRVLKNYNDGSVTNSKLYLHGQNDYPLLEKDRTSVAAENLVLYIYGLNGAIAKRAGSTVLFLLKDHLGSTRVVMDATGLVHTYYDYDALGNLIRTGTTNEVTYQFTGQEYDQSGLHNYRARLYDSDLGKFYATDPAGQFASPYLYAGNNPVILIDPNGEVAWFVPVLIGAAIGGGLNVYQNWEQIKEFNDAAKFFGVGFASGASSFIPGVGGIVAGAISGAGNAALTGGDIGKGIFLGSITGGVGGLGGKLTSKLGSNITINGTSLSSIKSPFVRGFFGGALGGFGSAFSAGFVGTLATGGDFKTALSAGLSSGGKGALMAAPIGAGAASVQARKMGLDPLTGKSRTNNIDNPVVKAERTTKVSLKLSDPADSQHAFPDIIDNHVGDAQNFKITGGDGRVRDLFQIHGSFRGQSGVFEWILEGSMVTHRRFIPNGQITGYPNQRP
ncbi:RHS repeat-associated core domain-containing protein [candidate division KSB1 bacterium]|nr:MAG: RHS repeat-associated core domain-containing protein [candidate division KSB1 bacterium]RIK74495.1 MAG: hypothetical protein DCC62_15165 [candidate division KSB1 bacterium]